jgi:hypothetical protein
MAQSPDEIMQSMLRARRKIKEWKIMMYEKSDRTGKVSSHHMSHLMS